MLDAIGVPSVAALFEHVPAELRATAALGMLPAGLDERAIRTELAALAARNRTDSVAFLGAGAYPHFIPAAVEQLAGRAEFATAYTPYQPEVSQGTLQASFEFQSAIAALLGMEVANAGMYDGATAAAEAVLMSQRVRPGRPLVLVARALHPHYRQTIATYLAGIKDVELVEVPYAPDGTTPLPAADVLRRASCLVLGYPNAFGVIEDLSRAADAVHGEDCLLVSATAEALRAGPPQDAGRRRRRHRGRRRAEPRTRARVRWSRPRPLHEPRALRPQPPRTVGRRDRRRPRPARLRADARDPRAAHPPRAGDLEHLHQSGPLRRPGRGVSLAARTSRSRGRRRAQPAGHPRARRAPVGVGTVRFAGPYFNEFVLTLPDARQRWQHALDEGVVAGLPLGDWYPELEDALLLCATELHDQTAMDRLVAVLGSDAARDRCASEHARDRTGRRAARGSLARAADLRAWCCRPDRRHVRPDRGRRTRTSEVLPAALRRDDGLAGLPGGERARRGPPLHPARSGT